MHSSTPLILSAEDKLDLLRYLDEGHFWRTLEDERRCGRCHELINGRQVLVFERRGTRGRLRVQCPTVGCFSTARDWDYPNALRAMTMKKRMPHDGGQKLAARPELSHNGRACTVRVKRRRNGSHSRVEQLDGAPARQFLRLCKTLLARSPMLRSIATGFHAIHPVA